MTRMLAVPRTRGVGCGLLLMLLGAWGALIPLVGPYFHYAYTPDTAWTFTTGRVWLEIVPGAATFLGGLILLASASRPVAMVGAWLAALAGAWFAVGTVLSPLWAVTRTLAAGSPVGHTTLIRQFEHLGFFTGLGVVIVFVAALALGRLSVIGIRDAALTDRRAATEPAPMDEDTATTTTTATSGTRPPARGTLRGFGRWLVARQS
jgi:hypothetical protein